MADIKLMLGGMMRDQGVSVHHLMGVAGLAKRSARDDFEVVWAYAIDDADLTSTKNHLLNQFMDSDCTHLLLVDGRVGFSVENVVQMLGHRQGLVVAIGPQASGRWPVELIGGGSLRKGLCVEARRTAMHFALFERAAVLHFRDAYPELEHKPTSDDPTDNLHQYRLFDPDIDSENGTYLASDAAFSERWRAADGEIWVDTDIELRTEVRQVVANKLRYQLPAVAPATS